jgi:hypothetical protein
MIARNPVSDIVLNFSFYSLIELQNKIKEYYSFKTNSEEQFISRYGDILGPKKREEFKKSHAVTKEKYIIKYGKDNGERLFNEKCKRTAVTLENLQQKYGKEDGQKRFDDYREKQRISNSFEYKNKKHNWSFEEYDKFNKSRAVTLENLQQKYGKEDGQKRFDDYREKQRITNLPEYLGEDRYLEINKRKGLTCENFINKYGENDGIAKFEEHLNKISSNKGFSKISQKLFFSLIHKFPFYNQTCKFALNNGEWFLNDYTNKKFYFYDFVCKPLKICIEFQGDLFHANPTKYKPSDIIKIWGGSGIASDIWELDKIKHDFFYKKMGFPVIEIWESDFYNNPEQIISWVIQHAKNTLFR